MIVTADPIALAAELTALLRTPNGTMQLRPLQARLIETADTHKRLFSSASVGTGKTLTAGLCMTVLGGERPLMLTSGGEKMVQKTEEDFAQYRLHWQLPTHHRIESYEKLGRREYASLLDELCPTCIVLDESHKLKAFDDSGRARRMGRWREENPDVPMIALSGSPGAKLIEYAHILWWVLGPERASQLMPGEPGSKALKDWCAEVDADEALQEEFSQALQATPGVVLSPETYRETPLEIRHEVLTPPDSLEEHFAALRDVGEAPDGWALDGPAESWTLARCLSNGCYYEHVPRPPPEYREAWKAWSGFFRDCIKKERTTGGPYDTPGQVLEAVRSGPLKHAAGLLEAWLEEKGAYNPTTQTVWFTDFAIQFAEEWGREHAPENTRGVPGGGGCIVWVEQTGVGEELARRTGWPYYGSGAVDAKGRAVKHAAAPVIIASVKACGTCYNLQHRYSQNLFLSPPSNNMQAEQAIGRTHRSGQKQALVTVVFLHSCIEDWAAYSKARAEARETEIKLTTEQKLSLARTIELHDGIPDATVHSAWRAAAKAAVVI